MIRSTAMSSHSCKVLGTERGCRLHWMSPAARLSQGGGVRISRCVLGEAWREGDLKRLLVLDERRRLGLKIRKERQFLRHEGSGNTRQRQYLTMLKRVR